MASWELSVEAMSFTPPVCPGWPMADQTLPRRSCWAVASVIAPPAWVARVAWPVVMEPVLLLPQSGPRPEPEKPNCCGFIGPFRSVSLSSSA